MHNFKNSDSNKRYYTYNYYLRKTYGDKCAKICLDANFSCPNRDGKISYNGCLFCSDGASENDRKENLLIQYENYKKKILNKWSCNHFIAYFQAFTNTYASLSKIKEIYEPFITEKEVVAINIATRPDCLEEDILDYLGEINKIKPIYIELGLQTSNDMTAKIINRGYDFIVFKQAVEKLKRRNIKVIVHLINGLPFETKEDNLETIKDILPLNIDGIKFHSLFINYNTKLFNYYLINNWHLQTIDDYIDILTCQIELLHEKIVIHRISGDPKEDDLFHPKWSINKTNIRNLLDKEFVKRNSWQGKNYKEQK